MANSLTLVSVFKLTGFRHQHVIVVRHIQVVETGRYPVFFVANGLDRSGVLPYRWPRRASGFTRTQAMSSTTIVARFAIGTGLGPAPQKCRALGKVELGASPSKICQWSWRVHSTHHELD